MIAIAIIPRPAQDGVYALFHGKRCVYIGRTAQSLSRPFMHSDKEWDTCKFIACERRYAGYVESFLISAFKPEHNKLKLGSFNRSQLPWTDEQASRLLSELAE